MKRIALFNLQPEELAKMVSLASPGPEWNGYCGPLRIRVRLPSGPLGQAEPLVVTGVAGAGDFVYVRYLSDGRISLGYDHWGVGGAESQPLSGLRDGREVELVICFGGLMPPKGAKIFAANANLAALRDRVIVSVDGRLVLSTTMPSHASAPAAIVVGCNPIGGSTTTEAFRGGILSLNSEPVGAVLRMLVAAVPER